MSIDIEFLAQYKNVFDTLSFYAIVTAFCVVIANVNLQKSICGLSRVVQMGISFVLVGQTSVGIYMDDFDGYTKYKYLWISFLSVLATFSIYYRYNIELDGAHDVYPDTSIVVWVMGLFVLAYYNSCEEESVKNFFILLEVLVIVPQFYYNLSVSTAKLVQAQNEGQQQIWQKNLVVAKNGNETISVTVIVFVSLMSIYKAMQIMAVSLDANPNSVIVFSGIVQCALYLFLLIQQVQLNLESLTALKNIESCERQNNKDDLVKLEFVKKSSENVIDI